MKKVLLFAGIEPATFDCRSHIIPIKLQRETSLNVGQRIADSATYSGDSCF